MQHYRPADEVKFTTPVKLINRAREVNQMTPKANTAV